jgi:mono/diheme cytochrome c family protein
MEKVMTGRWTFAALLLCIGNLAFAQPKAESSRGELLYTTHCTACHNAQVHWRDKKVARDWNGLEAEVRRWQGVQGLAWRDEDIMDVVHYLNARYYKFPERAQ